MVVTPTEKALMAEMDALLNENERLRERIACLHEELMQKDAIISKHNETLFNVMKGRSNPDPIIIKGDVTLLPCKEVDDNG